MQTKNDINIVLVEPEIPQNTGNIARTCAATGASLHLVRPLGFKIDDRKLKRAGLDYWDKLDITYYENLSEFLELAQGEELFFFTTKGPRAHSEIIYPKKVFLVFGRETKGLPEEFLAANYDRCARIPMRDSLRSLNLSNSVAVAVFEALRQRDYTGLEQVSPRDLSVEYGNN
jgi:rRNA methylase, putative, group 2